MRGEDPVPAERVAAGGLAARRAPVAQLDLFTV